MSRNLREFAPFAFAAILAGCAQNSEPVATTSAAMEENAVAEKLIGTYQVERVDGRRVMRDLSVVFDENSYGGHDGCNGYGGLGLAYGDRYISAPGAHTLLACSSSTPEGKRGLEQGQRVTSVVAGGFTARNLRNGRIELRSSKTRVVIARLKPSPPRQREYEEIDLAGRNWEAFLLNGYRSKLPKTDDDQYLRFAETNFTAKFTCDSYSGNFVQDGKSLKLSNVVISAGVDCIHSDDAQEAQFRDLMQSELRFVASKSSILIASREGELFGDRERLKSER